MASKSPKIVVCRQLGGIGDCIIMSCVYRGLKEKYPNSHITLITDTNYQGGSLTFIARHNPFIDKIVSIPSNEATTEETKRTWSEYYSSVPLLERELIWTKADIRIDLNSPCAIYEGDCLRSGKPVVKPRYEIWCERAEVVPSSYFPVYNITSEEDTKAGHDIKPYLDRANGKPLAALGLNAFDPRRGLEDRELFDIATCLQMRGFHVVTVDATKTYEGFDYIIGKPLHQLMPLLKQFGIMVTVDSGLLHMAGALGVPLVGIFGPTDPDMRMKLYKGTATLGSRIVPCAPCWYNYSCMDTSVRHSVGKIECLRKLDPMVIAEEAFRVYKHCGIQNLPVVQ